ncbi:MAG: ABC transporter permease [Candidatus Bipolaricaulota bacterium]|nr:ABC transporter permease [Candidatus Bipolaricaulota bacterium]MDW8127065.1 ABC transporter permease [Candidatus Bipolaricaulota bacterium]
MISKLVMQGETNPERIQAVYRQFMEEFGVGLPLWDQFKKFIGQLLCGDLGTSISMYPRKTLEIISLYLPWTIGLLLPAILVSWALGNYLGALLAWRRGTILDKLLTPLLLFISRIPFYWFAMLMLFGFAVKLRFFPIGGTYSWGLTPNLSWHFVIDYLKHYVLPFCTWVIICLGGWAIGMRSMMIYELNSDYIIFADVLGIPQRKLLRYAFRSACLPQITELGLNFGFMLSGSLLLELVFNYRGMGYITFQALAALDYPLIQGIFLMLAATVIFVNLFIDIVYGLIDPRIKAQ